MIYCMCELHEDRRSDAAAGCHLALELRHLLGQLGLEGLREAAEQTGRQLLLHVLLVLHLQGRQRLSVDMCVADEKAQVVLRWVGSVISDVHAGEGVRSVPGSVSVTPAWRVACPEFLPSPSTDSCRPPASPTSYTLSEKNKRWVRF